MRLWSFNGATSPAADVSIDWHATEPWVHYGMRTVTYLCAGLLAGSMLFSISAAIVTSGTVSVEGDYKTVQHLEGGIVSEILVHTGDRVAAGDVLVRMDDAQARADRDATTIKFNDYAIQEARLLAERDRRDEFEAPAAIDMTAAQNMKLFDAQQRLFEARRSAYLSEQQMLVERITQTDSEMSVANGQLEARKKELVLNELDLSNVRPLFDKSSGNMHRIGPLQRENVRIRADLINVKAQIVKLKSARTEAEARLSQIGEEYARQVAEDLAKVQSGLAEQTDALKAITDKLARTEIRAPVAGLVHAIAVDSEGGAIQPGGPLLQIIPEDRKLLIEAKIKPQEIDQVRIGQMATVRFSSFESHVTPRLEGIVRYVSAEEITGKDGKAFYTTRVEVPPEAYLKMESGNHLIPGMPAEVHLETPSRTILSFVLKPLSDMMAQSFREQYEATLPSQHLNRAEPPRH